MASRYANLRLSVIAILGNVFALLSDHYQLWFLLSRAGILPSRIHREVRQTFLLSGLTRCFNLADPITALLILCVNIFRIPTLILKTSSSSQPIAAQRMMIHPKACPREQGHRTPYMEPCTLMLSMIRNHKPRLVSDSQVVTSFVTC
jgi:hypothetical protein